MPWTRMLFKDQQVWVRVDGRGRPALDAEGRAEMKYRPDDQRSYRPAPSNLRAEAGPPSHGGPNGTPAKPSARAPRRTTGASEARAGQAPGVAPSDALHIWTDGACTGNPGPMGIGVVVVDGKQRREIGEYLGQGTNNIAELTAIERALDAADDVDPEGGRALRIYTDSAYSIGVIARGWKAKANRELVERLRARAGRRPGLELVKVPGHAGVPENERCDALARQAIERRR